MKSETEVKEVQSAGVNPYGVFVDMIVELRHKGLNKYRRITGSREVVQQKVKMQKATWDSMWQKKLEREKRAKGKQSKMDRAIEKTEEAKRAIEAIENTLARALEKENIINWDTLKDKSEFPMPKPKPQRFHKPEPGPQDFSKPEPKPPKLLDIPQSPKEDDPKYQPELGILDLISLSRKQHKIEIAEFLFERDHNIWLQKEEEISTKNSELRKQYQDEIRQWEVERREFLEEERVKWEEELQEFFEKEQEKLKQWKSKKQRFLEKQKQRNNEINRLRRQYLARKPDAILKYCKLVFSKSEYPYSFYREYQLDYNSETRILVIDYSLPTVDVVPKTKEAKYIQPKDDLVETFLTESAINKLYDSLIYQITLRCIHEIYKADMANTIDYIVFNGWVKSIDKTTGKEVNACILSVQGGRQEFLSINLANVDPKACFKGLKGVGSSKLHSLTPIAPIIRISREDKRFVSSYEVADSLEESTNIAAMDWEDFEHLVRELFEKEFAQNGGEVKVTRASRDGGVDAIAFDPDPIRGGKIAIQAKRYTNTIGVSAVRDLYGTVLNEGATKGILVTTADYGPDAYQFAQGKPLTLLDGSNLLHLLRKHGHRAKIDLKAARQILAEKEKQE